MAKADKGRDDPYEWRELLWRMTSNPKAINDCPATFIPEEETQKKRDADGRLSFVEEILIRSGRRLPPDRRKAMENKVIAFRMRHIEDIPVEIIAQILNCDDKTVYRYIAEVELKLLKCEKVCDELQSRFVQNKDWVCLQVLHYLMIGKQIENIILTSIREPFTLECADEEDKKCKLREIKDAHKDAQETYSDSLIIKWRNRLSLKDVVAATEKIRRAARAVFNESKRKSEQKIQ
jgi:hypothetical protein